MRKSRYIGKHAKGRCNDECTKADPRKNSLRDCKEGIYKEKSTTRNSQRRNLQKEICKRRICKNEIILNIIDNKRLNVS